MTRVFVTGLGVVSSIGFGRDAFWKALLAGRSGASKVETFDTSRLDRDIACEVKDFRARDFLTAAEARRAGRCSQFAIAAARMAVEDAALSDRIGGPGTSVVLGTTMGEAEILADLHGAWIHEGDEAVPTDTLIRYGTTLLPVNVARSFGARGLVQALPAACAAGNYAIGFAADQIRAGRADVVITGASEVIEELQYQGFVRLGAMAPDRVRPFDRDRKGILLGEGAGMMVLESEEHVARRGGTPLAEVGGYGLACDAHHITRPHPEGVGSARAMREAIVASGIEPGDVDVMNAHGTATPANDVVESAVIREVFGDHRLPVTSIKSMLGHCMGAASATECLAALDGRCRDSAAHPPNPPYAPAIRCRPRRARTEG